MMRLPTIAPKDFLSTFFFGIIYIIQEQKKNRNYLHTFNKYLSKNVFKEFHLIHDHKLHTRNKKLGN